MVEPPLPPPDGSPWPDGLTSVELEDALAARAPRRRRLAQSALVVAALVVALGALLRGVLPLPHWAVARTGAAPLQGSSGARWAPGPINILSNVSFGTVTLDGQRLRGAPPISLNSLSPGHHTLTLDAQPFPRETCDVYALGASTDGGTAYEESGPCWISGSNDRVDIAIDVSGADLPPAVAAQARDALRALVGKLPPEQATVPAGEYYATGMDAAGAVSYARATQPLAAQLDYAANTGTIEQNTLFTESPYFFGLACRELECSGPEFESPIGVSAWLVNEPVLLQMRFETASGTPVSALTIPSAEPLVFALAYQRDGTWQPVNVDPHYGSTITPSGQCGTGFSLVFAQLRAAHISTSGYGFSMGATGPVLDGCQITLMGQGGVIQAAFLWRFGVLQAADAGAHALLPALPVAPNSAAMQSLPTPTPAMTPTS